MLEYFHTIAVLFRKEMLMILKDKRGRFILIMPILAQTLLFGYVATYDLNTIEYALLDEDRSVTSRELIQAFWASPVFQHKVTLRNAAEIAEVLDNKKALLVLHIGPQFEKRLNAGQAVPVQVLVDGRNSNVAGTAAGYANTVIQTFSDKRLSERSMVNLNRAGRGHFTSASSASGLTLSSRAWFNPNLETRWNIISGMLAVLSVVQVMVLSGQSVAREKELGTFDQLLVTPFTTRDIMLGKALPPVLVGIVQSTLVLAIALYWFDIPFSGSLGTLYLALIIFNFAIVGIGLCISALTSTMQQAMLYSFTLLMPMILLSGFATPISSMPEALKMATLMNPVRYGVELAQRIYLEGAEIQTIKHLLWPLAAMALVTLGAASRLFRSKLG